MTEQVITPILTPFSVATGLLEEARVAHERYLIKQQDTDLEKAIDFNPSTPIEGVLKKFVTWYPKEA